MVIHLAFEGSSRRVHHTMRGSSRQAAAREIGAGWHERDAMRRMTSVPVP